MSYGRNASEQHTAGHALLHCLLGVEVSTPRLPTCPEVLPSQGVDEGGFAYVGDTNHHDAVLQILWRQKSFNIIPPRL